MPVTFFSQDSGRYWVYSANTHRCIKFVEDYFFFENYNSLERAVSHNVWYYWPLPITHYQQVRFYGRNTSDNFMLFLRQILWIKSGGHRTKRMFPHLSFKPVTLSGQLSSTYLMLNENVEMPGECWMKMSKCQTVCHNLPEIKHNGNGSPTAAYPQCSPLWHTRIHVRM